MGSKSSKNEKLEDHIAFKTDSPNSERRNNPTIVVTQPTPVDQPPEIFDKSNNTTNEDDNRSVSTYYEETPILTNSVSLTYCSEPQSSSPPPLPSIPPPPEKVTKQGSWHDEETRKKFGEIVLEKCNSPIPPPPNREITPLIKRSPLSGKEKIQLFEGIEKISSSDTYDSSLNNKSESRSCSKISLTKSKISNQEIQKCDNNTKSTKDNSSDDYDYKDNSPDLKSHIVNNHQTGAYTIDLTRKNFAFCGRSGAGKSTLINAIRAINTGDPQSAGRTTCDKMEPFRFLDENLQNIVLWELPYPRAFASVNSVFDVNMGFDQFYVNHNLRHFNRIFILIPDGAPTAEDITFARIAHSRRTPITFLSTKTDDDLDAESREAGRAIDQEMKNNYQTSARSVFGRYLKIKAPILNTIELLFVSAPTVRNVVCGTVGYLHYLINEEALLNHIGLSAGCHSVQEHQSKIDKLTVERPRKFDIENYRLSNEKTEIKRNDHDKSTVLADAGFEIMYGTDDRIYRPEPKVTITRAGKTSFNYGFIGGHGVGKSSVIDAMRGMTSRHSQSATKSKSRAGSCECFEFEDTVLKYSVKLYELHYPKKISSYFEFIDKLNIASFTALFILIDQIPSEADLSFAKIAYRQNTTILFLVSKCDKKLLARSRSDEIPVCDLLKQQYIDKAMDKFEKIISNSAPELRGRVNIFFVSAPVFNALRSGDPRRMQFILHERAVFNFLKSRRMIADMLDESTEIQEGLYANVNFPSIRATS